MHRRLFASETILLGVGVKAGVTKPISSVHLFSAISFF